MVANQTNNSAYAPNGVDIQLELALLFGKPLSFFEKEFLDLKGRELEQSVNSYLNDRPYNLEVKEC